MIARFRVSHDMHCVFVETACMTAPEIVRAVVDAIARNTTRTDRHACLHVIFKVANLEDGMCAADAAARRIRDLYRGPYERTFFTYTTEAK